MNPVVVDSNVAVVANGRNTHASLACQLACVEQLEKIVATSLIIIDDENHILDEYHKRLNFKGQPGVGDLFYKYILDSQYFPKKVRRVTIHLTYDGSFQEFPDDPALIGFDDDDHKFVAVALECVDNPEILNAVDTDWANFHQALTAHGLVIRYLCPNHTAPNEL